jgi:cytidylate kinase
MPVITVTRGSLSATSKLAQKLSQELHCQVISREEIIEHARQYGIDEFLEAARRIMESKPPYSWDPHAAQIQCYLVIFKAALMDFVVSGDVVYHGHQGHFLLTEVPRVLKVRIDAPLEHRVKFLVEESGCTDAEARERIDHIDEQRIMWARFLYGVDYNLCTNYDMVLNRANLNLDAMVGMIANVVQRPEFRLDAGALKVVRDAHLKALVMAHLVRSPRTRELEFTVECDSDKGKVIVSGASEQGASDARRKDIEDSLTSLDAVSDLEIRLSEKD